jgi:hypothetical protein
LVGWGGEMGKRKPLTEAEWVRRCNTMRQEIDEYSASIHPAFWEKDEHLKALKQAYLKLAGAVTK